MNHPIDPIIARVLTGHCSSEDYLLLSEWLEADEKNKTVFRLLKGYWDAEVSFRHSLQPGPSLTKLSNQIEKQERGKRIKRFRRIVFPLAAAAVALIAVFFLTTYFSSRQPGARQFYTYLTDKSKANLTLDDGTKIVLNRYSKLTYSDAYGTARREVRLEGEAYFEVAKNPGKPFVVDMGNASIRVIGTTFSVKAGNDTDRITAILLEGSIRFESATQHVLLSPDQQLTFTRSTHKINIQPVDAKGQVAWKDGLLKYKSIALSLLLEELGEKYGVPVYLENRQLADPAVTVSGTFTEEQSLEEILRVISRSLPIRWVERSGAFYIR